MTEDKKGPHNELKIKVQCDYMLWKFPECVYIVD